MRRHLLVVSEKKIKMLKTTFAHAKSSSIIGGATIIFMRTTYIHNKYMYTIRAYYLQYCGTYAPYRRHRTMDTRRWTLDAGP